MSRIIIIGGSGHVGSYLVPTLVTMGHEIVNVSRGISAPYRAHSAWEQVENVILDRTAEEAKGDKDRSPATRYRGGHDFLQFA